MHAALYQRAGAKYVVEFVRNETDWQEEKILCSLCENYGDWFKVYLKKFCTELEKNNEFWIVICLRGKSLCLRNKSSFYLNVWLFSLYRAQSGTFMHVLNTTLHSSDSVTDIEKLCSNMNLTILEPQHVSWQCPTIFCLNFQSFQA